MDNEETKETEETPETDEANEANEADEAKKQEALENLESDFNKILTDAISRVREKSTEPGKPTLTRHGTPCARSWDEEWTAKVEATEKRLHRPVCGAHTMWDKPCEITSKHKSGRCRFHGGFDVTGAPKGNRNAAIHNLYSRRLRQCERTCPMWDKCPCSGADVDTLPVKERPTCPYEQATYNAALTDAQARASTNPHYDPMSGHISHNLALMQVMLDRASIALSQNPLVEDTKMSSDGKLQFESKKLSPYLTAFLRISSEYRRYAEMLRPKSPVDPEPEDVIKHQTRMLHDTKLDPEGQPFISPPEVNTATVAKRYLRKAIDHASVGRDISLLRTMENAYTLSPELTEACETNIMAMYRPPIEMADADQRRYIESHQYRKRHGEPDEGDLNTRVMTKEGIQTIINLIKKQGPITFPLPIVQPRPRPIEPMRW